jgi:hypothetical protein
MASLESAIGGGKTTLCLFCCCAMYIRVMSSYKNYTIFFEGGRGYEVRGLIHLKIMKNTSG